MYSLSELWYIITRKGIGFRSKLASISHWFKTGVGEYGVWEFNHFITEIIYTHLNELYDMIERDKFSECYPANLSCKEEWLEVLNEIIHQFKMYYDAKVKTEHEIKEFNKALELFSKYFHNFWN